jgi:4-hydroxy-3-polyprenylbenzoate decarboxylase
MGYRSLRECVDDLERTGQLVRIHDEVSPELEAAEIQRRVFAASGPAVFYERVRGCAFPMVSNLFGTMDRVRFIFRDALDGVRALVAAKVDPKDFALHARRALGLPGAALHMLPIPIPASRARVLAHETRLSALPRLVSWPDDGGPFITLPQVYTEDPNKPGVLASNLGMYRVQLAGNDYLPEREVGLHYQLHRGIGVHHAAAIARGKPLDVNIFVGGPPAMAVAAVMPLPEGLPELAFAGALNRRGIRMARPGPARGLSVHADADFCIRGFVNPHETKREGPFGDHLGYYARAHDFPLMHVTSVHHRDGAIWPFTTVGRPPQEDTLFGALIHELTGPLVPTVLPGVRAVHAVDAAGVHPLLLAIGSERYVPYARDLRPMELLTQASAILGQGQMSLAKYLFIVAEEDARDLAIDDIESFFRHVLERIDTTRDLHFVTNTTMDTLDYSGTGLNQGSKVIVAAAGKKRRTLPTELPASLSLPDGFRAPRICMPGVLAVEAMPFRDDVRGVAEAEAFAAAFNANSAIARFPLIVLADDSELVARSLRDFLWVTFTRSNPAVDVHGIEAFVAHKAWGCRGSIVIDARRKPHHAPPLVEDPKITQHVDSLATRGGPLWGLL